MTPTCSNCRAWNVGSKRLEAGVETAQCQFGPPTPILVGMAPGASTKGLLGLPQGQMPAQPIIGSYDLRTPANHLCCCWHPSDADLVVGEGGTGEPQFTT